MDSNTTQHGEGTPQDGEVLNRLRPRRPVEHIKAEAVASRLKAERVQEELKSMPGWQLTGDERAIDRAREFPSPDLAVVFVNFVAMLSSLEEQPVDLSLSAGRVVVTLSAVLSTNRRGVTQGVLDFARMLG
jgi:pterin-4a-carbinolamine dehydratase